MLNLSLNEWLYRLENSGQQEIQMGLDRIKHVATDMDLLTFQAKIIIVGGTNGKGSTVAALEAIYSSGGYRVASYTSPHLLAFNERIRVNQKPISDAELCLALAMVEQGRGDTHLTYFEMTTLAALWHFKSQSLDIIILEVGLGGRLDATNIVDADVAILTTVDLDHQEYLGETKEEIGFEKAGILRQGKPFIYADNNPPLSVIRQANLLNTPTYILGENYSLSINEGALHIKLLSGEFISTPLPKINYKAAAAALLASSCLLPCLPISPQQWALAMQNVQILGRQQVLPGKVTTLLDVAHNPQAASLLAEFIHLSKPKGRVHAVFSALKDKDLLGLIKVMLPCIDFWYPAILDGPRAASESLLLKAFQAENCFLSKCYKDPSTAYQSAVQMATPGDLIVVYGSFLTVSAVMTAINNRLQEELQ